MARKRVRKRPRERDDKEEKQPIKKANALLWALGVGIMLGALGFILGSTNNLRDGIVLAIVGFVLGAFGGAISVIGTRWPTYRYRAGWSRKMPSIRGRWYRPDSPVPHLSDEYYYDPGETYRKGEEEEED